MLESTPTVRLRGGWEDYLATRTGHLRKRVRYAERRLRRDHVLAYRLCTDSSCLERDMATLFALHASRWRGNGSGALEGERGRFHVDFAAHALARGWLRLWFLELDGRPVAAWYGLRLDGVEWFYQAGRDPACDRLSVGFVLLAHTIRAAADDGMREYRLLHSVEDYRARWTERDRPVDIVAAAPGRLGNAAVAAAAQLSRRPRARPCMTRLAG